MKNGKDIKEKVMQAIKQILANQNSDTDVLIAKRIIENTTKEIGTDENSLLTEQIKKGVLVVYLVSPMPEEFKFEVCNFDIRFGDLTIITEAYVAEKILNNLNNLVGRSSR
jgi:hypothetical protein